MEPQRLTGPESGVLKYDLLTALSVAGLNGSSTLQTSLMRLIALVTARYNWKLDELSVGQREMARMWSVNERTVKREMKRLTETGILICKRGGVRGRVGAYRLNYRQIAKLSEPCWPLVGPDFDDRMRARYATSDVKVVQLSSYKPPPAKTPQTGPWAAAMSALASEHSSVFEAWFAQLTFLRFEQGRLHLSAPSKFIRRYVETHHLPVLIAAAERQMGPIEQVLFEE